MLEKRLHQISNRQLKLTFELTLKLVSKRLLKFLAPLLLMNAVFVLTIAAPKGPASLAFGHAVYASIMPSEIFNRLISSLLTAFRDTARMHGHISPMGVLDSIW